MSRHFVGDTYTLGWSVKWFFREFQNVRSRKCWESFNPIGEYLQSSLFNWNFPNLMWRVYLVLFFKNCKIFFCGKVVNQYSYSKNFNPIYDHLRSPFFIFNSQKFSRIKKCKFDTENADRFNYRLSWNFLNISFSRKTILRFTLIYILYIAA